MKTAILFDATRKTTTKPSTFGKGLLRAVPFAGRMPFTAADEADYVEMMASSQTLDRIFDRLAEEAAAMDRLESGLDA